MKPELLDFYKNVIGAIREGATSTDVKELYNCGHVAFGVIKNTLSALQEMGGGVRTETPKVSDKNGDLLSTYTPVQLMEELARRGYDGEILPPPPQKIRLSKFAK